LKVFVAFISIVSIGAGCSKSAEPQDKQQKRDFSIPVEVLKLAPQSVEYAVSAVGAVEAFEQVQVTARVAGVVEKVNFKEGDEVKEGAPLAEIEPDRYRLAVQQAQAALARAKAARIEAERELERAQKLQTEGVGSAMTVSTWETKLSTAGAEEAQAQAQLSLASLNLRDARLRAPIKGTIQSRNIQTGQYVQAGSVLATLMRRDPLLLKFKVTEADATRLRPGMKARFQIKENPNVYSATMTYVASSAEQQTRMVPIIGEIEGPSDVLRPGAFAEVTVPIQTIEQALVVPQTAIRPSERGFLAFVVEGKVARERKLDLGMRTPKGLVEVRSGLNPGELLVVRGAEALKDKSPVRVSSSEVTGVIDKPAATTATEARAAGAAP
jgi:membrane fusion protein (multidrug efflux system)/multidrug efflux system membrane fusion protein